MSEPSWPTEHPDPLRAAVYQALNRIDAMWDDEHASARATLEKVEDTLSRGLITSERQAAATAGDDAVARVRHAARGVCCTNGDR
jgi:hypothetical protein